MNSDKLLDEYRERIERELSGQKEEIHSVEYDQFRKENLPQKYSIYERACNWAESVFKIAPDAKTVEKTQQAINNSHLNITPTGVMSFSILGPMILSVVSILLSLMIFGDMLFVLFFIILGVALVVILQKVPGFIETDWRMKAGNQLVLAVFYIVTYMRHTSNLENAIDFASNHLDAPISIDMKKVLWDVETQKFESIKESLDNYLVSWRKWNPDFVESMNLIQSSLYEGEETRRLATLDKSLSVILEGTYESMLHYAHNLKGPITMLHMLGVILPILGLVILPLVVSFMDNVRWYHIGLMYNVALPLMVYYLGRQILSTRPSGYGSSEVTKKKKIKLSNLSSKDPIVIAAFIMFTLILIGVIPLMMHTLNPDPIFDFCIGDRGGIVRGMDIEGSKGICLLDYKLTELGIVKGPYGLGAALLSVFIPLGLGLGISLYFGKQVKNQVKIRRKAKLLEKEFASALFQLGGRLGDGVPAEMAFGRVAVAMEGTTSGEFFKTVDGNIRSLGMSVEDAIYDEKNGAINEFPSKIIDSSMKVLLESSKKGPLIASQALNNVARYIKEIHRVDERLQDLMGDIIGSMKSQIKFLTPVISGIVVGITSMITGILGRLQGRMGELSSDVGGAAMGGGGVMNMFGAGVPTYFFQVIVGVYVVQIIVILIILSNQIENGPDKVMENYRLGKELASAVILYCLLSFVIMIAFNVIANSIMSSTL